MDANWLQMLASVSSRTEIQIRNRRQPCLGCLQKENFSNEIIESISPEDLQPIIKLCVDGFQSPSIAVKQSAKNRADNRALIGEFGVVPALILLLRWSDPWTQNTHAVTTLLNLSLHKGKKSLITSSGAIKSLMYVLKTGTKISKRNAACALLSLSLIDENKQSIEFLRRDTIGSITVEWLE